MSWSVQPPIAHLTLKLIFQSGVSSLDPAVQFAAVQSARKILSRERNPPIEALIATGTIPRFVEFLAAADKPKLQFEVCISHYELTGILPNI